MCGNKWYHFEEMDPWLGTRWGGDLKDPRDKTLVVNHTKWTMG